MDRVLLTREDIAALMDWRDEHKELVRSFPAPLKSVEILFTHNNYRIIGIRSGNKVKLQLFRNYESLGWAELEYEPFFRRLMGRKSKLKITEETFQSVLTVYCSLMALMVYGNEDRTEPLPQLSSPASAPNNRPRKASAVPKEKTTYILRRNGDRLYLSRQGSHASPSGVFSVRGHYRRYKSGKVIWISEYKKGTGKNKPKTYRIGGQKS